MDSFYQRAALSEYKNASDDLSRSSDGESCTLRSYKRHDDLVEKTLGSVPLKIDCKAGCSYCCYFKVEVKAYELFLIVSYLKKTFSHNVIHTFTKSAERNAEKIRQLSREEHFGTNFECPFLLEKKCRIYPVRPYACRNFHATNRYNCMLSYENPSDSSIPNTFIPELHAVGQGHRFGYEKALAARGFDMRVYDMNTAFLELLRQRDAKKRYVRGECSFPHAILIETDEKF